jgi:heme/copper-type cytochrome/quinol oxidase subunit 3
MGNGMGNYSYFDTFIIWSPRRVCVFIFMLTGFRGLHITLVAIVLANIWASVNKGHFSEDRHVTFEAAALY